MPGEDGLAEVQPDLGRVDVEGRHELDVTDVVAAEGDVHQTRHGVARIGVAVVLDALDQRAGAVADAGDGDPDLVAHGVVSSWDMAEAEPRNARGRSAPVGAGAGRPDELGSENLARAAGTARTAMRRSIQDRSCSAASRSCSMRLRV